MRASPGIRSASPLVPAPRRADLGSDGFIAAAISPSAPAFPNSPNPLSRSVPGRRTEANCLLERAGSDARVTRCVFPLKQWGHLHARPRALFPLGTLAGGWGEAGRLSTPGWEAGEGKTRGLGPPLRCRAPGGTRCGLIPVPASPPAREVQPGGCGSATLRAASASDLRSKCFSVGEDVHGSVSFLVFRFNLLPLQTVKHARAHTHAHTHLRTQTLTLLF